MPIARFEMPDGKIARFEVPEGTTPEQAQYMIAQEVNSDQKQNFFPQSLKEAFSGFVHAGKQALSGVLEGAEGVVNLPMEAVRAAGEVTGVPRQYLPLSTQEIYQRQEEAGITAPSSEDTGSKAVRFTGQVLGGSMAFPTPKVTETTKVTTKSPSVSELKSRASRAYQKAEDAGVVVSKDSFSKIVTKIGDELNFEGLDKTLHPKATAALKRLSESADKDLSFKEMDVLRRVLKGVGKSIEPDERRLGRIMVDSIDDYMTSLKAADIVSKDPSQAKVASEALTEARNLWTRASKGQTIENLITRAQNRASQFSGSGYENALRTEFRNLAQSEKKMRLFTRTEQNAIRKVARGGAMENSLRMLGKLAPTGIVSTALGGGVGFAVGGPVGGAAVLAAGTGGRIGARILTARNANLASETMRGIEPVFTSGISQIPSYLRLGAATVNPLLRLSDIEQ